MVTGGIGSGGRLDTTELFTYTGQGAGSWRVAGPLMSPRMGLRVGNLEGGLFAIGGFDAYGDRNEILTWLADTESWFWYASPDMLATANYYHGVTEVSLAVLNGTCNWS